MKLLLLGGTGATREVLRRLVGTTRQHRLYWHPLDDASPLDTRRYDLVLVDGGAPASCTEHARLIERLRRIRRRSPDTPVVVLSPVEGVSPAAGHSCGIRHSDGGDTHFHCRLKELAWNETAALLRDALNRPLHDAVTFDYQG